MPFETKPRIARKSNPPSPKTEHAPLSSISKSNVFNHDTKLHSEFKPHGGVTFHKNTSLEVELVGRGYSEDSQNNDARTTTTTATTTATQHGQKNKETKKPHSTAKSMFTSCVYAYYCVCVCVCVCMCTYLCVCVCVCVYVCYTIVIFRIKELILLTNTTIFCGSIFFPIHTSIFNLHNKFHSTEALFVKFRNSHFFWVFVN